jgi:ribosomal protein L7/L12
MAICRQSRAVVCSIEFWQAIFNELEIWMERLKCWDETSNITKFFKLEVSVMSTVEQQEINLLRSRIVHLEAQVEFLYRHLGVKFMEQNSPDDDPRILDALRRNNMIEAIKIYRQINDTGLAEAKAAVEAIRARRGI